MDAMSHRTFVVLLSVIIGLGAFFLIFNLTSEGFSYWDLRPIFFTAVGVFAVFLVRRNQRRGL